MMVSGVQARIEVIDQEIRRLDWNDQYPRMLALMEERIQLLQRMPLDEWTWRRQARENRYLLWLVIKTWRVKAEIAWVRLKSALLGLVIPD